MPRSFKISACDTVAWRINRLEDWLISLIRSGLLNHVRLPDTSYGKVNHELIVRSLHMFISDLYSTEYGPNSCKHAMQLFMWLNIYGFSYSSNYFSGFMYSTSPVYSYLVIMHRQSQIGESGGNLSCRGEVFFPDACQFHNLLCTDMAKSDRINAMKMTIR